MEGKFVKTLDPLNILWQWLSSKFYFRLFVFSNGQIHQGQSYLSYNAGHNILRHFDIWENFGVTTSEIIRDY